MHNYQISNKLDVDKFMSKARESGDSVTFIKGSAPCDALYSDGLPVSLPVNIGAENKNTGERILYIYEKVK